MSVLRRWFCCCWFVVDYCSHCRVLGKRELVALLCLSSWCLVIVVWLFLSMSRVCLQFVMLVFSWSYSLTIFVKNLHIIMCPHKCQHNCSCTCEHAVVFSNNVGNSMDPDQFGFSTRSHLILIFIVYQKEKSRFRKTMAKLGHCLFNCLWYHFQSNISIYK